MEFKNEKELHKACVKWLKSAYPQAFIYHAPAESKRTFKTVSVLKSFGFIPGCPDLLIFNPVYGNSGLAIEFKHGKNKPTDHQILFLENAKKRGYKTLITWSLDEFIFEIEKYLS
jgi:hypothetical protein